MLSWCTPNSRLYPTMHFPLFACHFKVNCCGCVQIWPVHRQAGSQFQYIPHNLLCCLPASLSLSTTLLSLALFPCHCHMETRLANWPTNEPNKPTNSSSNTHAHPAPSHSLLLSLSRSLPFSIYLSLTHSFIDVNIFACDLWIGVGFPCDRPFVVNILRNGSLSLMFIMMPGNKK